MRQDNVPGFPGYYISKSGRVYNRYIKGKIKCYRSRLVALA